MFLLKSKKVHIHKLLILCNLKEGYLNFGIRMLRNCQSSSLQCYSREIVFGLEQVVHMQYIVMNRYINRFVSRHESF